MQPQVLEVLHATSDCPQCGDPVIEAYDSGNRRKLLAPLPCMGGLYKFDQRGRVWRRPLRDLVAEHRRGAAWLGGGYDIHQCDLRRSVYPR